MKPIPTIALEADKFGVSNRAAAAISTSALIDYRVVSAENRMHIDARAGQRCFELLALIGSPQLL